MKKKLIVLAGIVAIGLVIACSRQIIDTAPQKEPVFPTATSHYLFRSASTSGTLPPILPEPSTRIPTIADVFHVYPSATPYPEDTSSPPTPFIEMTSTPIVNLTETPPAPSKVYTVTVYQDDLSTNWEVQRSTGMEIYLNSPDQVYHGKSAIAFTPQKDYGVLFFTVASESQEFYLRDSVKQLSFWLYSGEDVLALDKLTIAIVSSNSPIFWSADDHPITTLDEQPVFSETRSYYLPLNHSIPAHTWVPVELDLDTDKTLISDPDYRYITGFYLKTEAGFSRTLSIDDISLEMIGNGPETPEVSPTKPANRKVVSVQIDTKQDVHPISQLIYGVSGAPEEVLRALRPALNSWGGDSSTRYNWEIGHAWNGGLESFYRNGNYGITSGSASDDFISRSLDAGADVRLSLPTLGWVAKNDDPNTCSFPLLDGSCGDADEASCLEPGKIADPYRANVPSYLDSVMSWVQHMLNEKSYKVRFFAMDNEPELWGITHYDVHPQCTTYNEILRRYLLYTHFLQSYAPEVELVGPVTSGWYYYWNSAAGETDKLQQSNHDFLPWFLRQLQLHDREEGRRSLHVLDIHYYPENVYNDQVDEKTAELRLRSTRSLWDKEYVDESWIGEPVYLIPRMKALIEKYYPGTKLGISEWNWGAEKTMNGALAIADVLGIFGREDLYYAAYWQYPPINSPGFFAFKMYTNFDDLGGHFGDTSVMAKSGDDNVLGSYAALDSATSDLYIMLLNKQAAGVTVAQIDLDNYRPGKSAEIYRYDEEHPEGIQDGKTIISADKFSISMPANSITLLVIRNEN